MANCSGGFKFPIHNLMSKLQPSEIVADLLFGNGGVSAR